MRQKKPVGQRTQKSQRRPEGKHVLHQRIRYLFRKIMRMPERSKGTPHHFVRKENRVPEISNAGRQFLVHAQVLCSPGHRFAQPNQPSCPASNSPFVRLASRNNMEINVARKVEADTNGSMNQRL